MNGTTTLKLGPDLSSLFAIVSPSLIAEILFGFIVLLTVLYTLIATYHWVRYGHRSVMAIPAVALHIFVSVCLVVFAATGLP